MNWNHAAFAIDPRHFGRGPFYLVTAAPKAPALSLALKDDVRLFATTFAAGFLFVYMMVV